MASSEKIPLSGLVSRSGVGLVSRMMDTEDQDEKLYLTYRFRVKDRKRSLRCLREFSFGCNTIWNFCNEVSKKSADRSPKWVDKKGLRKLTKGSSKLIGLPSQVIQEVIDEFTAKRKAAGKPKLRWRVSRGAKRSLGWVPFTNQDITVVRRGVIALRGEEFHVWHHRLIPDLTRIKSGCFAEDARGRWYVSLVVEVDRPERTNRTAVYGGDPGQATALSGVVLVPDDGESGTVYDAPLDNGTFYRDMEARIAEAQRAGRKRHVKALNAKVKNRRLDSNHKYTTAIVRQAGAIFVGDLSCKWQIASNGKGTHDNSWAQKRTLFRYKSEHAGVLYADVPEAFTTQVCSHCHAVSGPKGREELGVRRWVCGECGTEHTRDQNAAVNIARLGCETLGLKWPRSPLRYATGLPSTGLGSFGLQAGEASL